MNEYLARAKISLNVKRRCEAYGVGLWQCPQFLFIIMGIIIIASIIVTNVIARHYTEPEIAALIVIFVTLVLFVVGNAVVHAFDILAEASRAKSEFIRIVSQEMRTPLSAIKWQIDLLTTKKETLQSEDYQNIYGAIDKNNEKMIRLVSNLLEAYKIEDNELDLRPVPISLKALTEKVIEGLMPAAREAGSEIKLVAPDESKDIMADERRLRLVLEHLLDNAIKYGGGNEILVTIENKPSRVVWAVTDQGIGMSKQELGDIFKKFYRSGKQTRFKTSGFGLGLYLSKEIIKALGGDLRVKSIEGHGSTFWFDLPLKKFAGKDKKNG